MSNTYYYVIDEWAQTSCNIRKSFTEYEKFCTLKDAELRAIQLARQYPGRKYFVCDTELIVECQVADPKVINIRDYQ